MLTASPTDVLSHVAIRARSQGVLLATCFNESQLEALKVSDVALDPGPHWKVNNMSPSASGRRARCWPPASMNHSSKH